MSRALPLQLERSKRRGPAILPATRIGTWAIGLAATHVLLVFGWRLMGPLGAFPGFACGVAAGICAIVALRRRDRAVTVYAALVPLALVVLFVVAEIVAGTA